MKTEQSHTTSSGPFRNVVFAGGGGRCIWQGGFWEVVAPEIGLNPSTIAAVSAGSLMACLLLSERTEVAMEVFVELARENAKNVYWEHAFSAQPMFPQSAIYRKMLEASFGKTELQRLKEGPDIRLFLARLPRWLGARSGALLGFLAYNVEKKTRKPLHPQFARRLGFRAETASLRECQTPEELADLILQSSCTPPFTPIYKRSGQVVLDGGLVDNVPVEGLGDDVHKGNTLVLLSRPYPPDLRLMTADRLYVHPATRVPLSTWDYSSPEKVRTTYEQGLREGELFLKTTWLDWKNRSQTLLSS